jgi:hypothetical protein
VSGRPSAATEKALKAIEQKRLNPYAAAKKYGLSPSTLYRALAKRPVEVAAMLPRASKKGQKRLAKSQETAKRYAHRKE